jgi:hypothetical protein
MANVSLNFGEVKRKNTTNSPSVLTDIQASTKSGYRKKQCYELPESVHASSPRTIEAAQESSTEREEDRESNEHQDAMGSANVFQIGGLIMGSTSSSDGIADHFVVMSMLL